MCEWQLIETAPRDGTQIKIWDGRLKIAYWDGEFTDPTDKQDFRGAWVTNRSDGDPWYAEWAHNPTHWKPLDGPPRG